MKPAGLILAAGESTRMGSDKALLDLQGVTFLDHILDLFLPRVSPVVVILGHHAQQIEAAIAPRPGLRFVVNLRYADGQLSSLQTGIRALPADAPAALLTLVDHPAVAPSTLDAILARALAPLVIPRYQGRRGHPILLARALLDEILALPPTASAKDVVRAHAAVELDLDDPGVLRDIDTPADYELLR
ncbi:MAG: nucleotidyltransferase family protein [Acidobacteria bacterium]|nr:nucleotidyltransferase family protein [Acidobacteriota bacterium]